MRVGMDAKQTGDCTEQGTATAYMLKCPISTLQAVHWLERYEETTAATTVATDDVSEGESAQNRGQRVIDEYLYNEWLYSSDDEDDDVRYLDTLRALHMMDFQWDRYQRRWRYRDQNRGLQPPTGDPSPAR